MTKLTRRELFRWSAGSLLAAGLWPGAVRAEEKDAAGEFHFLVVNDIHHLNDKGLPWLEALIKQMKAHPEKPEFCLIVGDLAENGKPGELRPVREGFKKLDLPVYEVIGNHDYQEPKDRKAFEELFPDRLNYRFEHRGWRFLGLDSSDGTKSAGVAVQQATLKWLDDNVGKLDAKMPTVIFTHFPLGPLTPARVTNANDVLGRFKEINLQAVFNGHFHGFTERKVGATTFTTNKCCSFERKNHDGTKEKGYFLCQAREGKVTRRFVEMKPPLAA
jgi:3',5'-cyclic AMP phosphodiesterase CpdA